MVSANTMESQMPSSSSTSGSRSTAAIWNTSVRRNEMSADEALARPLGQIFVGYDEALLAMTVRAFRIYSFSFLLAGVAILGSSFFTALNDGLTSALISFLRTLVFQVGAVLLLPAMFALDGIWYSIVVAEVMAVAVSAVFLVAKRKKYRYF